MTKPLGETLLNLSISGFRLAHLGQSGKLYHAIVYRGFDPRVNVGCGRAWDSCPEVAVEKAYELCLRDTGAPVQPGKLAVSLDSLFDN